MRVHAKINHEAYIEDLRQLLQLPTNLLPDDKNAQKGRKERGSGDLEYFGKTYFPHYIYASCSEFHKYLCRRFLEMITRSDKKGIGDKEVVVAPRGNAKSTWSVLIFVIWAIVYQKRKFILIVSETSTQAEDFMTFIKSELEKNERLQQDFPHVYGEGEVWRADTIVTRNGIKIRGAGAGQKLRGMRHGNVRPDLVLPDDLENDEQVESAEQRRKLSNWFFKALLKIGQKNTIYLVTGTILHFDSLLSNLLNKPGWKGRKFKAILRWSQSKLWEEWERIYCDLSVGKEEADKQADAFFKANKDAMLKGTEVLWPEVEDYYYLMKVRTSEGIAHFESEKQNEPINHEDAVFLEEWFQYWEEGDIDFTGISHVGTCDPSLGKRNKRSDPSAIIAGYMKDNILYLDVADIERRQPDKIMSDLIAHHTRKPFDKLRIESVQFQEFFLRQFEKLSHEQGMTINIEEYCPNSDKDLRIIRLQPWIKNGWIRLKKEMFELKRQLIYYRPKGRGGHDDGPDALEMLLDLCEKGLIKAVSISDERREQDYHFERESRFGFRIPERFNQRRERMVGIR